MTANKRNITDNSAQAAEWLKQGQLLAYPTESVWGIGCDAYNEQAVQQILAIKNRPSEKGMIVVTDSYQRIEPLLAALPDARRQQVIQSWSQSKECDERQDKQNISTRQANTWLLPLPKTSDEQPFPVWITGKHNSMAVRVIAHPLIAQLCEQMVSEINPYGLVVSTSCNPSGETPAATFDTAYAYFGDDITYLIGDTLKYTLPSQIRDALTGQVIR